MRFPMVMLVAALAGGAAIGKADPKGGSAELDIPYAEGGDQ
jgi:hypothetical protein